MLPVGVDTSIPSATASVRNRPPTKIEITLRCGARPRCSSTSFIAYMSRVVVDDVVGVGVGVVVVVVGVEGSVDGEEEMPMRSRLRSRILDVRVGPMDLPRIDDQPERVEDESTGLAGVSACSVEPWPATAPDM